MLNAFDDGGGAQPYLLGFCDGNALGPDGLGPIDGETSGLAEYLARPAPIPDLDAVQADLHMKRGVHRFELYIDDTSNFVLMSDLFFRRHVDVLAPALRHWREVTCHVAGSPLGYVLGRLGSSGLLETGVDWGRSTFVPVRSSRLRSFYRTWDRSRVVLDDVLPPSPEPESFANADDYRARHRREQFVRLIPSTLVLRTGTLPSVFNMRYEQTLFSSQLVQIAKSTPLEERTSFGTVFLAPPISASLAAQQ